MSKFRIFRTKSASTASTASTFSRYTVEAPFPQSRGTVEALAITMVRCISLLKPTFFSLLSRGCRGSFPNSSQENENLREGMDISPVDDEFYSFGSYPADEYDYEDYKDWYEDMCNDVGWPDDDGCEDFDGEFGDCNEDVPISWEQRAVDEAIDEEQPGQYPPGTSSSIGDIPF